MNERQRKALRLIGGNDLVRMVENTKRDIGRELTRAYREECHKVIGDFRDAASHWKPGPVSRHVPAIKCPPPDEYESFAKLHVKGKIIQPRSVGALSCPYCGNFETSITGRCIGCQFPRH